MFADRVAVNGSCTHFVRHVSVTPLIVGSIAVDDTPCERALEVEHRSIVLFVVFSCQ